MKLKKTTKCVLWYLLAAFFFFYYAVITADGGFSLSFAWIWPLGAAVCFLFGRLTAKHGKLPLPAPLRTLLVLLFLLALAFFLLVEAQVVSHMADQGSDDLDCIIVLGAKVRPSGPSRALRFRIDAAFEYLTAHPDTVAILSGGRGADEPMSEAECMYRALTGKGIAKERLILEEGSRDTKENIRNSFALLDSPAKIGLVTASYHVYRALSLAKAQDSPHTLCGIAAKSFDPLFLHFTVREFAGVLSEWLEGNMKLELF